MATLSKKDQDVQSALLALESHVGSMSADGRTVEQINEYIASAFQSHASSVFQGKVGEWLDAYGKLMQGFRTLQENLRHGGSTLSRAQEEASQAAGNSFGGGVSEVVMATLGGGGH